MLFTSKRYEDHDSIENVEPNNINGLSFPI